MAVAHVPTIDGAVDTSGDTRISGVPGQAAGIAIDFLDITGSSTGALFPTSSRTDTSNGIEVTCVDNGMPVILMRAADLGVTGYEPPSELETNKALKQKIERIRLEMAPKMNLGDVRDKTVPKMSLLAPAQNGGLVMTRTFIPHRVHQAIGVLGAVSVATGCLIEGTVAAAIKSPVMPAQNTDRYAIEHPTGQFEVDLQLDGETVLKSALVRTARKLMSGDVFVPRSVWSAR